jgi:cation-transporting P-type ATPase C
MRVAPGADGVSIWSPEIFGSPEASRVQDFLSRTFAVTEVKSVELRRASFFGRIRYGLVANPRQIWKKLSRALSAPGDVPPVSARDAVPRPAIDASLLYLENPGATPVHVSRIGGSLSTWRVRHQSDDTLRLWHPVLRNRRDIVFRLEEELAAILGVEDFRASALTAGVAIRFDKTALTVEHLARELEKAWPRLLAGLDGPPSRTRFFAVAGLLGLAFTGQYLVPPLRPVAVAGVALYSSPNVVNAVKQLARGEVGLYALYSVGLAFTLISGMPFASTAIGVLMQFWPQWSRRKVVRTQRRLFARQRRLPVWARISNGDGIDTQVSVDNLGKGDLVFVRSGETVPVDGVVQDGSAAVVGGAPFSTEQVEQRSQGDRVLAGTFVRNGDLTIRVERTGSQTSARYLASLLPHAPLLDMPSSWEAERIANRNARAALALSAVSLAVTRSLRLPQAVIRADYATGPRLSAQLSAFQGVAQGSHAGIFFRNPAALDRLAGADVYVIDDSAGLDRRRVQVDAIQTVDGVAEPLIAHYALLATGAARADQRLSLATLTASRHVHPKAESVRHYAGVTRYRDSSGSAIEVATTQYVVASKIDVPRDLRRLLPRHRKATDQHDDGEVRDDEPSLRPLWVSRDREVIGVVSFGRTGEIVGKQVVSAIRTQNRRARLVYLSRGGEARAGALARELGVDWSHGALSGAAKANLIRGIKRPNVWIGDGTDVEAREAIVESTVSVSAAALQHARQDFADILIPHRGIDALPALIDIGREHELRLARDYRTVYAVNLLGLGGAIFARFNALQTGLISNVGTGLIYARHARALDRLASAADDERALLSRSAAE